MSDDEPESQELLLSLFFLGGPLDLLLCAPFLLALPLFFLPSFSHRNNKKLRRERIGGGGE